MEDVKNFKLNKCPDTAYYIPDFVTEKEEKYLLDQVYKAPKTKWVVLSNRRLQNWGGLPHPKGMVQEAIPQWLKNCCESVSKLGVFQDHAPNHILVNEYKEGQGIMPHEDGPLYFPTVSTISLGSHTVLEFYDLPQEAAQLDLRDKKKFSLLLEPRSLLILQNSMYLSHMHGISENTADSIENEKIYNVDHLGDDDLRQQILNNDSVQLNRTTRVSLTIRHVPKTVKLKLQIGKNFP